MCHAKVRKWPSTNGMSVQKMFPIANKARLEPDESNCGSVWLAYEPYPSTSPSMAARRCQPQVRSNQGGKTSGTVGCLASGCFYFVFMDFVLLCFLECPPPIWKVSSGTKGRRECSWSPHSSQVQAYSGLLHLPQVLRSSLIRKFLGLASAADFTWTTTV